MIDNRLRSPHSLTVGMAGSVSAQPIKVFFPVSACLV